MHAPWSSGAVRVLGPGALRKPLSGQRAVPVSKQRTADDEEQLPPG